MNSPLEYCKSCNGYRVDCPQHVTCPNQTPEQIKARRAKYAAALAEFDALVAHVEDSN